MIFCANLNARLVCDSCALQRCRDVLLRVYPPENNTPAPPSVPHNAPESYPDTTLAGLKTTRQRSAERAPLADQRRIGFPHAPTERIARARVGPTGVRPNRQRGKRVGCAMPLDVSGASPQCAPTGCAKTRRLTPGSLRVSAI